MIDPGNEAAKSLADMNWQIGLQEGLLLANVTGAVSFSRSVELYKEACDTAATKGLHKILIDCLGLEGELSHLERYKLGREMAEHWRHSQIPLKIAVLGTPPTITGFAVGVSQNHGANIEAFADRMRALAWLYNPTSTRSAP
jgi:hypothetical protein